MPSTSKEFQCKFCGGVSFLPDAIKSYQLLVVCPVCDAVHAPIDFYPKLPGPARYLTVAMKPPPGITVQPGENELIIIRTWWRDIFKFTVLPAFFWVVVVVLMMLPSLSSPGPTFFICFFLLPFLGMIVGLVLAVVNKTTIRVTPKAVEIEHGPIPFPFPVQQQLLARDILQAYVAQKIKKNKNSKSYSYNLQVVTKQKQRDITLLKNIKDPLHVLFIEQQIEKFLKIPDLPTYGEYGNILSVEGEKAWVKAWKSLASNNNLLFTAGKLDAYGISGLYRNCRLMLSVLTPETLNSGTAKDCWTELSISVTDPTNGPLTPHPDMATSKSLTVKDIPLLLNPTGSGVYFKGKVTVDDTEPLTCTYLQGGVETDLSQLQFLFDSLTNMAHALPKIVTLGGEAVPQLKVFATDKQYRSQEVAMLLLQSIARDTSRWQEKTSTMLCPTCFTYWSDHDIGIRSLNPREYYGCRICGQSHEFIDAKKSVIAVLDHEMIGKVSALDQVIRVNWFTHNALFDFNEVEIISATDEEAERFAVKVGNDTDPFRQPDYKKMRCWVSEKCDLSKNSIRVLQKIFGEVTYVTFEQTERVIAKSVI